MPSEIIKTETNDKILEITFQMNEKNVIDASFGPAFQEILESAATDKKLRAMIIKGSNGFFSNGFDPTKFVGTKLEDIEAVIGPAFSMCEVVLHHPLPNAMVINGHAMGYGAILCLYGDYRFMQSRQARFGFPEIQIGLPIPMAPAIMLQDLTGKINSRELVFGAKALKADQARDWNIVDEVFDDESTMVDHARKQLSKLFKYPRSVISLNKEAFNFRYRDMIKTAIQNDIKMAPNAILQPPGQEGLAALHEGRRPNYDQID